MVSESLKGKMTDEEMVKEPSFKRIHKIITGKKKANVEIVTGVNYQHHHKLSNHTDAKSQLFTMSVAIGNSCSFTVGKKTHNPHKKERSGKGVTLTMESGDAMFFDGGCNPHQVDCILKDTAPKFWSDKKY